MRADGYALERTVVLIGAVVDTLLHGAFDAMIRFTMTHFFKRLLFAFRTGSSGAADPSGPACRPSPSVPSAAVRMCISHSIIPVLPENFQNNRCQTP